MMTRDELLSRARETIASTTVWCKPSWRNAAEDMAAPKALGASQRQIAKAVGMSSAWVHGMLRRRAEGYKDGTPFGPASRASRERARDQATDDQPDSDQAQAAAARARAKTAKAEAAKAKADAAKATAEARRVKAEALKAQAEAARAEAEARSARARSNNPNKQQIHSSTRDLLVKALGMLGSDHVGERDNAARLAERLRAKLGLTWSRLIVRARDDDTDEIDDDEDLDDDSDDVFCDDEEPVA
jgi:hypothetical protein